MSVSGERCRSWNWQGWSLECRFIGVRGLEIDGGRWLAVANSPKSTFYPPHSTQCFCGTTFLRGSLALWSIGEINSAATLMLSHYRKPLLMLSGSVDRHFINNLVLLLFAFSSRAINKFTACKVLVERTQTLVRQRSRRARRRKIMKEKEKKDLSAKFTVVFFLFRSFAPWVLLLNPHMAMTDVEIIAWLSRLISPMSTVTRKDTSGTVFQGVTVHLRLLFQSMTQLRLPQR